MKWLQHFFKHDVKLAMVSLMKLPGFSLTVISTLAITLAALAVVLNINYLVLGKALPYPDSDSLITTDQSETINGETQYGFQILSAQFKIYTNTTHIDKMALMSLHGDKLNDVAGSPYVEGVKVTPEYFTLLDVPMHLGRYLTAAQGLNAKQQVVVLSYPIWQKHFASDPSVIGQYTRIGNDNYQIIGVSAASFIPPEVFGNFPVDLWLSFNEEVSLTSHWNAITGGVNGIARLKPGVTLAQASSVLGEQINALYQGREAVAANTAIGAHFVPLKAKIIADSSAMALMLLAGVITLLFIAITNMTNLFLSRAAQKQRVMAIQAALGALPKHLLSSMFAEALILCLAACVIGLIMAGWVMLWLEQDLHYMFARLQQVQLDVVTVVVSFLVSIGLALVMATLSCARINYVALNCQLQGSGKGTGAQISTTTRHVLVATQVGLATVLLFGATSLLSPAIERLQKPTGLNTDNVYYLSVDEGLLAPADRFALSQQIKQSLIRMPQISDVASTEASALAMGWENYLYDDQAKMQGIVSTGYVDSGHFALFEHPILAGRTFVEFTSSHSIPTEIIISQSLAQRLFGQQSAIGKTLQVQPENPLTVVGVVSDIYVPDGRREYAKERYYVPYRGNNLRFSVKVKGSLAIDVLQAQLKQIDAHLTVGQFTPLAQSLENRLRETKLVAILTINLIALALSLAAAGIYGVLSYSVQMRRYELGIHLSLGAHTHTVINMVLKQSMRPVIAGLIAGVLFAVMAYLLLTRIAGVAFEGQIIMVFITLPVMLLIASLACYLPVKKVVAGDPLQALRIE
ncbi:ABC transporter permease [Pseudoalteromonas tunicata]|uniref:ABC transporter permease n=1 Tax=Pseudoalteromonas tunicata TaxID=314281 RepID=UPI00273EBA08|nr:ABC transporter permease [Pseudoalteromonas tunicata]MDP5215451.1 ABC transporter permease [Pseudoalteromonas tunicata]